MACDLINVGYEGDTCVESFAGTGIDVFLFLSSDLKTAPQYDTEVDETTGRPYNRFTADSFMNANAKKVKIKAESGEVTWTFNGNNAGYTASISFLVDGDINAMAVNNRTLGNLGGKFGVAVPVSTDADGNTIFDIIYDHVRGVKLEVSGTSGKAAADEKGHTVTISCATMLYGPTTWTGTEASLTSKASA